MADMIASEVLAALVRTNLAAGAAILLVLGLRKVARPSFGARLGYRLWLLPMVAALAVLAPPRQIVVVSEAPSPSSAIAPLAFDVRGAADDAAEAAPIEARAPLDIRLLILTVWLAGAGGAGLAMACLQRRFIAEVAKGAVGPAVVGMIAPRIVIPTDFASRFSPQEQTLVLAHEQAHLDRQDSRLNGICAAVQCLFWFNPLVHLAAHLMRIDQEMACDETVVGRFPDARRAYAEALMKAQLALRPLPLGCYWPSAAEHPLYERIAMLKRDDLGRARRLVGAAVLAALCAATGAAAWASQPPSHVLASSVVTTAPDPATLLAEQEAPQQLARFDPAHFDKYVGYYQLEPYALFRISREGPTFLAQLTGQQPLKFYPESETKFFFTVVPAQISFETNARGEVAELVLHQNGRERHARRIDPAVARRLEAALAAHIQSGRPSPGTEASVRKWLASVQSGRPNYHDMTPEFAAAARVRWPATSPRIKALGALKAITFLRVNPRGDDIYQVDLEHGRILMVVAPLTPDGKVTEAFWQPLPPSNGPASPVTAAPSNEKRPSPGPGA